MTTDDNAPLPHIIASAPLLDQWWVDDDGRILGRALGAVAQLPLTNIDVHASWANTTVCIFRLGVCAEDVTHSLRRAARALAGAS